MRIEILNWLKQAESDLEKAKILFNNEKYDGTAFNSHQAVEKSLKALHIQKFRESEKGHSIIYLAQKLKIPKEFLSGIRDLNPEYLVSKYPDIVEGVPAEIYDKPIAERHLNIAIQILKWVKKQIQN